MLINSFVAESNFNQFLLIRPLARPLFNRRKSFVRLANVTGNVIL